MMNITGFDGVGDMGEPNIKTDGPQDFMLNVGIAQLVMREDETGHILFKSTSPGLNTAQRSTVQHI